MPDLAKPTLNLVKLCVGTDTVEDLLHWQSKRSAERLAAGLDPRPRHVTRMWPRRADELLQGGSLVVGEDGIRRCAIVFEPPLIPTAPRPRRPFQGWRYFPASDAPPDIGTAPGDEPDLPPGLREELTRFGVLRG
jgi:hypothetical protein